MGPDAAGGVTVPPHFRPTDRKLLFELEGRADGGFLLRATKGRRRGKRPARATTVEVRPDGVTVLSPGVLKDGRRDWPVERIVEVRPARQAGVCLTVREPAAAGAEGATPAERWTRVCLPVLDITEKQQGGDARLMALASPWLAGEIGRVLRRPKLPDEYVAGPGWVDASVEDAGRHGQLVYGVSAPGQHADPPPVVDFAAAVGGPGPRIEAAPQPVAWGGLVVLAVFLGLIWLAGVGVCAGLIGRAAVVPAGIFAVLIFGMAVFTIVGTIVDARQRVVVTAAEPGVVEVDVRRFGVRRRRRLTREEVRAVYVADGRRTPCLVVSRRAGKDKVLLCGLDPAVVRAAAALIERHLQLEPAEPVSTPPPAAPPPTPAVPVVAPVGPCPAGWVVREGGDDGPGTWSATRPAAGIGEKARTGGCLVMVIAAAVGAGLLFPGRGPVPGVGGVIMGGIGFLMLVNRIERALGPATVRYDGAAVHVDRRGIFGRVRKRVDAWAVERVVVGAITAGEDKRPTAGVELRLRDGTRHSAIGVIPEPEARWLARKLASALDMTEEAAPAAVAAAVPAGPPR